MSQTDRVLAVLLNGKPASAWELIRIAYKRGEPSSARLAARIYDLKKMGCKFKTFYDEDIKNKYYYQLTNYKAMKKMYSL